MIDLREELDRIHTLVWYRQQAELELLCARLDAKLDALDARIRRDDSRGIDCDVRDELIAILETDR